MTQSRAVTQGTRWTPNPYSTVCRFLKLNFPVKMNFMFAFGNEKSQQTKGGWCKEVGDGVEILGPQVVDCDENWELTVSTAACARYTTDIIYALQLPRTGMTRPSLATLSMDTGLGLIETPKMVRKSPATPCELGARFLSLLLTYKVHCPSVSNDSIRLENQSRRQFYRIKNKSSIFMPCGYWLNIHTM